MKTHAKMKTLLILVALWASGVFIAQQLLLPQLKEQVAMGLKSGLNEIGDQISSSLNQFYEQKVAEEIAFIDSIPSYSWNEDSLYRLQEKILPGKDASTITRFMTILFPDSMHTTWNSYIYLVDRGSRKGNWIKNYSDSRFLTHNLETAYHHWNDKSHLFWQNRIDSTLILFGQINAFRPAVQYIYEPVFENGKLLAFICFYIDEHYVEKELIPRFFTHHFWPEDYQRKDGIKKEFLDIRIRNEKNDIIYYSQILYRGSGEVSVALSQSGLYMSQYMVDLGFFSKTSQEVAASLHQRNFWLVNIVFLAFLLMLFFIYRTYWKSLQLDQLKVDFMANISHELKSPLAAIRMANDTLRLDRIRTESEGKKVSGIIQDEVIRLEKLVSKLLDFSQLEAGERMYHKEEIHLEKWWTEWSVKTWEKVHLLGFDLSISDTIPEGWIYMDPVALEEILEILLDNAMKYSGDSREIILETHITSESWIVSVQDFGIGISTTDQKQIFEKFRRLEDTQTHNVKGYGLGLSIAKRMLETHSGNISVESRLGEGSVFTVELPLILREGVK